jgi:hypothetical protein
MIQIDILVIPIWLSWHGMHARTKQVNGAAKGQTIDRPTCISHSPTRNRPNRFSGSARQGMAMEMLS